MLADEKLIELRERKLLLLAESRLNRRVLSQQWEDAAAPARRLAAGLRAAAGLRPYAVWLAPLAGFLLVRRSSGGANSVGWLWRLWRVGRRLFSLWRWWTALASRH